MITSFFVRLYNALIEARMRAAMRELAHHPAMRRQALSPVAVVPQDSVKAGDKSTRADAGLLPFVRGA